MNILPMIPVQSQVTQSNCEEAKKLFGKYTLQGLLDELDIIECFKQPGKAPYIGEILTKQRDIYCVMDSYFRLYTFMSIYVKNSC